MNIQQNFSSNSTGTVAYLPSLIHSSGAKLGLAKVCGCVCYDRTYIIG